ncbi:flagellar biosynthetic protein FliR [Nitrospira lenta]|uniref:Flagellar biosynthetic protein FliR n=1 Tax=Nitrospira lenta TaxID=1436998 RepID=A0A330L884_9BACT|nr:flagellar biosynthetic protein FliR [Nitrospira lenta]SPP65196.1 Flagellar biosynthetic protein fliR [Nitrospira lenta]
MGLTQTIHILLPQFQAFLVLVSRIGGLLAALPVFSGRTIPVKVKLGLVLTLSLMLASSIPMPAISLDPMILVGGMLSEMMIGVTIGLAVRLLFGALEVAGELLGIQMGFGAVHLFDPTTSQQTPMLAQFFTMLASLIFLSLNAHLFAMATIIHSYEAIPAFGAHLSSHLGEEILLLSQRMFTIGLKLSAPVLIAILLINVLMALLGRAVPQVQVFVLSFPITIAGGLLVLSIGMPFTVSLIGSEFEQLQLTIEALLRSLGRG